MLVLDRRIREGFWIDGQIYVKVLSIGRKRVKLGIEAPSGMKIVREELLNGIARSDGQAQDQEPEGSFRRERR